MTSIWQSIEACEDVQPPSTAARHHYHGFRTESGIASLCCHCLEVPALHDQDRACRNIQPREIVRKASNA